MDCVDYSVNWKMVSECINRLKILVDSSRMVVRVV